MPSDAVLYQAAALCLTYPGEDFRARLPLLREAAPQLRAFADHAAVTPARELAAHYGQLFGAENRQTLCLTWWGHGGVRGNGTSLARFADVYRAAGLTFTGEEVPDFLPAVLEYTARTGDTALLTEHRDALRRLRSHLTGLGTPYASVLDAVCAALPAAGTGERP
ncbi:nitrate reductase molybdenum cofactor assembly chaperone [Streptomyces sediminimaris]|uniref:nitrate reductase molybdenum cofactor assembly chaperone n=1 Tax=Streptomyces sediminimaris TaxID=3383721 RepID=UPI00399AF2F5